MVQLLFLETYACTPSSLKPSSDSGPLLSGPLEGLPPSALYLAGCLYAPVLLSPSLQVCPPGFSSPFLFFSSAHTSCDSSNAQLLLDSPQPTHTLPTEPPIILKKAH